MTRLDISNGYQCRLSPDGKWLTSSNVECLLTPLVRDGEVITAGPTTRISIEHGGQSYGGWWLRPAVLSLIQDRGVEDRLRYLHDTRTGLTELVPGNAPWANDVMARDGHFADSMPGNYYDGARQPESSNPPDGPLRICEDWTANTERDNRSLVVRNPAGAIVGRLDYPFYITGYILGPAGWVVLYREHDPKLYAWHPTTPEILHDITIAPVSPEYPWGEGLGWCWRRPNGDIWLATWTLTTDGRCFVLVRPLLNTPLDVCLWRRFGGINYISAADDGDHLVVAGAYHADAYATAFQPGSVMTKFTPDEDEDDDEGGDMQEIRARLDTIMQELATIRASQISQRQITNDIGAGVDQVLPAVKAKRQIRFKLTLPGWLGGERDVVGSITELP